MTETRFQEAQRAHLNGDFATALHLYETLAATGSKGALLGLADIYHRGGNGVLQDFTKARYWYERAVKEAKSVYAALWLGHFYYHGMGVDRDYNKAFSYYSKLEHCRDPIGLYRLGVMYDFGYGVLKDKKKAIECYRRSSRLGNIWARMNWKNLELRRGNLPVGIVLWVWIIIHDVPLTIFKPNDKRLRQS